MQDWPRVHRAFWRATLHCFHPKVLLLTLAPLAVSAVLLWVVWAAVGERVMTTLRAAVSDWPLVAWLETMAALVGLHGLADGLTQAMVLLLCLTLAVFLALLVVSATLSPALVGLVARARFPTLQAHPSGGWWAAAWWSGSSTVIALGWWLLSLPLWLVPLGSVILPPLVWGWLTFRVLSHDALAEHAQPQERTALLKHHRLPLMLMGVVSAYLGAAPAHLLMLAAWTTGALGGLAAGTGLSALGAMAAVAVPLALGAAIWIYTMVFAWSSLWFTHFLLEALATSRQAAPAWPGTHPPTLAPT